LLHYSGFQTSCHSMFYRSALLAGKRVWLFCLLSDSQNSSLYSVLVLFHTAPLWRLSCVSHSTLNFSILWSYKSCLVFQLPFNPCSNIIVTFESVTFVALLQRYTLLRNIWQIETMVERSKTLTSLDRKQKNVYNCVSVSSLRQHSCCATNILAVANTVVWCGRGEYD
jgi:hypothetical protein